MTYATFLAVFVVLPAIALGVLWRRHLRGSDVWLVGGLALLAAATAYPWDSWAVERGYWRFDPARVLAWLGPLPIEECAFFLLQTALVGLVTSALLRRAR